MIQIKKIEHGTTKLALSGKHQSITQGVRSWTLTGCNFLFLKYFCYPLFGTFLANIANFMNLWKNSIDAVQIWYLSLIEFNSRDNKTNLCVRDEGSKMLTQHEFHNFLPIFQGIHSLLATSNCFFFIQNIWTAYHLMYFDYIYSFRESNFLETFFRSTLRAVTDPRLSSHGSATV